MELKGLEVVPDGASYAHLAPEQLAQAAGRIERSWAIGEKNSAISLREKKQKADAWREPLLKLARPERFELPTPLVRRTIKDCWVSRKSMTCSACRLLVQQIQAHSRHTQFELVTFTARPVRRW
jgi:hypothetical protein